MKVALLTLALAVGGLVGCTADAGAEDSSASEESELRKIRTEFACGEEGWDLDVTVKLSSRGTKLHVEWGLENVATGDGVIDPTYRPRAGNASFVRFVGFKGLDDAWGEPQRSAAVLVEKSLLEGKPGRVKLQFVHANGEFEQRENACL
jgi:hypothetical protein